MDLKEIEEKIRAEHADFADAIDCAPSDNERQLVWLAVCTGYKFGFMRGMTSGLEQHAKVMDFALGKIFGRG